MVFWAVSQRFCASFLHTFRFHVVPEVRQEQGVHSLVTCIFTVTWGQQGFKATFAPWRPGVSQRRSSNYTRMPSLTRYKLRPCATSLPLAGAVNVSTLQELLHTLHCCKTAGFEPQKRKFARHFTIVSHISGLDPAGKVSPASHSLLLPILIPTRRAPSIQIVPTFWDPKGMVPVCMPSAVLYEITCCWPSGCPFVHTSRAFPQQANVRTGLRNPWS